MRLDEFDRAAIGIGAIGVLSPVFALSRSSNTNFVLVRDLGLVVLPVLGVLAVLGGLLARPPLVTFAGALCAVAGLLQLAQFGRSTDLLQGNGSTATLLLGLALGLLTVGLTHSRALEERSHG